MTGLTHRQYDVLEHAIASGRRIAVMRRGTEYVIVPIALRVSGARETLDARHPTTGEPLSFFLDDLDGIEAVR